MIALSYSRSAAPGKRSSLLFVFWDPPAEFLEMANEGLMLEVRPGRGSKRQALSSAQHAELKAEARGQGELLIGEDFGLCYPDSWSLVFTHIAGLRLFRWCERPLRGGTARGEGKGVGEGRGIPQSSQEKGEACTYP